jgi:hypothetical protein
VNLMSVVVKSEVVRVHVMTAHGRMEVYIHAFFISVLDGVNGHLHAAASLPPGNEPPVPWRPGRTPDHVWTLWTRDETRPAFRNYSTVAGTFSLHFVMAFDLKFIFILLSLIRWELMERQ